MTPNQRALFDKIERERAQVRDWLMELMAQSPLKPATKAELCVIAMAEFGVSKSSFNAGWGIAILGTGNEHKWEPLPRKTRTSRTIRN